MRKSDLKMLVQNDPIFVELQGWLLKTSAKTSNVDLEQPLLLRRRMEHIQTRQWLVFWKMQNSNSGKNFMSIHFSS